MACSLALSIGSIWSTVSLPSLTWASRGSRGHFSLREWSGTVSARVEDVSVGSAASRDSRRGDLLGTACPKFSPDSAEDSWTIGLCGSSSCFSSEAAGVQLYSLSARESEESVIEVSISFARFEGGSSAPIVPSLGGGILILKSYMWSSIPLPDVLCSGGVQQALLLHSGISNSLSESSNTSCSLLSS